MFLFRHTWSLLLYNVCCFVPSAVAKARLGTTSDLNYVDTIQSMNGIAC